MQLYVQAPVKGTLKESRSTLKLTLFSTILCAHLSRLSSSPDTLLTDFAPEAFDKEDLPSSVFTDSGRLKPVVPMEYKTHMKGFNPTTLNSQP